MNTALARVAAEQHGDRPGPAVQVKPGWDRRGQLLASETAAIVAIGPVGLRRNRATGIPRRTARHWKAISRLVQPLDAARETLHHDDDPKFRRAGAQAAAIVLQHCADSGRPYWAWPELEWARLCGSSAGEFFTARTLPTEQTVRPFLVALGYLLGGFTGFQHLGNFNRLHLACLVFGEDAIEASIQQAAGILDQWGYQNPLRAKHRLRGIFSQALLINHSPRLEDLTTEAFEALRAHPANAGRYREMIYALQRACASLGSCDPPVRPGRNNAPGIDGTSPHWAAWVERWHATSPLSPRVRAIVRTIMAKAGRWLAAEHPEITEPGQWTRQTCAAWVAAVDRMAVGDYVQRHDHIQARAGKPILPRSKVHILGATRTFLRDLQEWEWIPRRFDPARALAVPRSVNALIGTSPRVIAEEVWAKLMWAGLNLQAADLPGCADSYYPIELIRALTLTWLFSGLRSDELSRLRAGCIRWQHDGQPIAGDAADVLAEDAVCLLDVPVHKTGTAFTKPVDPIVGQAIEAWQALRPAQPPRLDRKTGEHADILFSVRAHPVARDYINRALIPALCAKAGVPDADVRGKITSHRARSTIASQLYNAKEPMTLFELQAWLGHRNPASTQHYAKITPNTLTKAYTQAGYFARNIRTIEVLLDRDAVTTGAAAGGQPWQHYDLGHGYCSYTFFEQCPHRMACARCDFYTPKDSSHAQLLEAKDNLQRMLASIPLTDDERAAVEDGKAALDALLARLTDIPTPAGATPRQIGGQPVVTMLPIAGVRHGKRGQPG
ncbi:MAG: site-specific integrase [Actinobacteria bacterium]|nr:site-specific integrase [Actinomycetota bacterium]